MSFVLSEQKGISGTDDSLQQYLQDIRQYPRLTPQQEKTLAKRCAQGDHEAIRQMVNANLPLVVSVAKEYAGRGHSLLDLIQEGSIGLLAAAKGFDYTLDYRFSTYATKWIRQGIQHYLLEQEWLIRVPRHTAEQMRQLRKTRRELAAELGRQPTDEELARRCAMPVDKVKTLQERMPQILSLDAPAGEQDNTLQKLLCDLQATQPHQELVRRSLCATLDALMDQLDERQRLVLRLRFGMEDGVCHSFEQIGTRLAVSKERARQIEKQALDKLKQLGADLGLEDFLE